MRGRMPAKTKARTRTKVSTFVFDGIEVPLWPTRAKGSIPRALIRKAVRAALADERTCLKKT